MKNKSPMPLLIGLATDYDKRKQKVIKTGAVQGGLSKILISTTLSLNFHQQTNPPYTRTKITLVAIPEDSSLPIVYQACHHE